jgi:hypothetical protein
VDCRAENSRSSHRAALSSLFSGALRCGPSGLRITGSNELMKLPRMFGLLYRAGFAIGRPSWLWSSQTATDRKSRVFGEPGIKTPTTATVYAAEFEAVRLSILTPNHAAEPTALAPHISRWQMRESAPRGRGGRIKTPGPMIKSDNPGTKFSGNCSRTGRGDETSKTAHSALKPKKRPALPQLLRRASFGGPNAD